MMNEQMTALSIGTLLRTALKEQDYSMRQLGERTGIDTATISRIINHKRKANLDHLEKFSLTLNIPLATLLQAAGYRGSSTHDEHLHALFNSPELLNENLSIPQIENQLSEYRILAATIDGKNRILKEFEGKIEAVGSIGPLIDQMKDLFHRFKQRKGSSKELAVIGGALLYFIVPADLIPDYLFAIGYLDDAVAVKITSSIVKRYS